MAFHRIHFLANETPSSKSLNHFNSIALDSQGNVYISGNFGRTADFDPGPRTFNLTAAGGLDVFVCKLNTSGNFVWAKKLGGASSEDCSSMALDLQGNIYISGNFRGTADFDPGPNVFNLISAGANDIFAIKLDPLGRLFWAKQMGGLSSDGGASIAVDTSGNIYTTGNFGGTADFDPGPSTFNLSTSGISPDIFVSKLDASGNFLWAKQMGGRSGELAYSIALDGLGNIFTTGFFRDTADFDPGPSTFNLIPTGGEDMFISK
jgi:hypothetical protein